MKKITVKIINGREYKNFETDKLIAYFDKIPVDIQGNEFIATEIKLKTVDGGRTSGIECFCAMKNFEVRVYDASAYAVHGEGHFSEGPIKITSKDDALVVATPEGNLYVGESDSAEIFA